MQELSGETGITPAYAGKRQRRATACTWLRDHPRVCGEKDAICKSCPARQGSPSRMRGKAGWPLCGLPCIGITPAYAGKSQPWRSYSQRRWDHPRVCGEKRPAVDGKRPLRGSPPHVRGKVQLPGRNSRKTRITPACAGKSQRSRPGECSRRDHPRVCGEKLDRMLHHRRMTGSPPRVRGKGAHKPVRLLDGGITPAYAGKSSRARLRCRCTWDHPRVCGEKIVLVIVFCSLMGSPPRMRGKVMRKEILRIIHGITPAYAGKREGPKNAQSKVGDHPRVCGEKCIPLTRGHGRQGSPPRMRGKVVSSRTILFFWGITPAYAGKRAKRVDFCSTT